MVSVVFIWDDDLMSQRIDIVKFDIDTYTVYW